MKLLFLIIALLLIILALRVNTKQAQPPKEKLTVQKVITIRKQDCSETDGKNNNIFKLKAINTTDNDLDNLVVDLAVGVANQLVHKEIAVNHLAKGGVIYLEEEMFYPTEIDVCFAKFSQNGQQILAVFRP